MFIEWYVAWLLQLLNHHHKTERERKGGRRGERLWWDVGRRWACCGVPECTGGSDCADTHTLVIKENKTDLFLIKVVQTLAYSELFNDIFQCFANIKLLVICEMSLSVKYPSALFFKGKVWFKTKICSFEDEDYDSMRHSHRASLYCVSRA